MSSWTAVAPCRSNKDSSEAVREGVDSVHPGWLGLGHICSLDGLKKIFNSLQCKTKTQYEGIKSTQQQGYSQFLKNKGRKQLL